MWLNNAQVVESTKSSAGRELRIVESIDAYRAVAKRLELQDKVQMEERLNPPLKFPSAYVASGTS